MEDQGIILRRLPYSETSLIVSWLTERHGLVRTLAKGAAKPRQPLYGKTDIFSQGRVCWVPSARSQLHILREVAVEQAHRDLAKSYASLLVATYFGEVICRQGRGVERFNRPGVKKTQRRRRPCQTVGKSSLAGAVVSKRNCGLGFPLTLKRFG